MSDTNPSMPELTEELKRVADKLGVLERFETVASADIVTVSDPRCFAAIYQAGVEGMANALEVLLRFNLIDMSKVEEVE